MAEQDHGWHCVYEFWFPPELQAAGPEVHGQMFRRWFGEGANSELPPFAPLVEAARAGRLDRWQGMQLGRLSLILVLDQFPRGLFAGTPEAYACDLEALRVATDGLDNGHYDALAWPCEKTFFFLPLAHAEGPDHQVRLERVVTLAEEVAREVSAPLRPLYEHSVQQARDHLDVISRFGRYPHRNSVLGRPSTLEEAKWLAAGNFIHTRQPPHLNNGGV